MLGFIVRRVAGMALTMLVVASIVFLLTNIVPGSPAGVLLGPEATDEQIRALDHELGLDRPLLERFAGWFFRLATGNLGASLYYNEPVGSLMLSRLEPTLFLTLAATAIAVGLGMPLGIIAAVHHRTPIDLGASTGSLVGLSIPNFWLGLNLILLFGLYLNWLPTAGYQRIVLDPVRTLQYLAMPALTLGVTQAALIARMTRASLLEVLRADYVRTARAKGLGESMVILKHALRNALIPTLSVVGLTVALNLGGSVVTESVFAIPGVGRLMVQAVLSRDFPVIQGLVLMIAATVACVNLIVDVLYAYVNPVVRYT